IRIEKCDEPTLIRDTKYIDISETGFNLEKASELLLALYDVDENLEVGTHRDIYISRSWHEYPETEVWLATEVCEVAVKYGFRLVGDTPDQQGFDKNTRIRDIISSCSGFIAILPDRGGGKTSKYMLQEIEIASALNL